MIGKATTSLHDDDNGDNESKEKLCHLTIEALGDEDHKKMLRENNTLKMQQKALMNLRNVLMRVDISHSDGTMSFNLDEGEVWTADEGNSPWTVKVVGKEHSSIAVTSITSSSISLSGVQLNYKQLRQDEYGYAFAFLT